jgi:hypothetical protein
MRVDRNFKPSDVSGLLVGLPRHNLQFSFSNITFVINFVLLCNYLWQIDKKFIPSFIRRGPSLENLTFTIDLNRFQFVADCEQMYNLGVIDSFQRVFRRANQHCIVFSQT